MEKNNCIKLYKVGNFYGVNGDDGIIIHELFGYKFVISNNGVGFPSSALGKVKSKLDNNKISYEIYEKDVLIEQYKGIDKNYKRILKIANENMNIETRIKRLQDKINSLDENKLKEILTMLENVS